MLYRVLGGALLGASVMLPFAAVAVPAYPGLQTVKDAEGNEMKVRLCGDEFHHQWMTEDGYPLSERGGAFYYCNYEEDGSVVVSDIAATAPGRRDAAAQAWLAGVDKNTLDSRISAVAAKSPMLLSMEQSRKEWQAKHGGIASGPAHASGQGQPPFPQGYGLFSDLRFPAYGAQKAIVILVEYNDVRFDRSYDAHDYFSRMLNEDGFNTYSGTGSAAQYFREQSCGAFTPEFDVYGPVRLPEKQSYYGGNNSSGSDKNAALMVVHACDLLDDTIDFRDYDRNGDGIVDNVFIFYAGKGEASGGGANTVWPHSWNLYSAGYGNVYHDGVLINTYGCTNEWENGRPDGVGTFIHEFSHVMGLPDLYATSYTGAFTPGSWSALDYGPYNNGGRTPPNYGAFERYALGWMRPREVTGALSATLEPVTENAAGIIRTASAREFFLLENRQQTGWDSYVPGHGMLVWHVDYNTSVWNRNQVNNTPSHQYVDIEEADGSQSEYSRAGDAFPGTANKTAFSATTNPSMKNWAGDAINFPISGIAESNGIITFNVLGGAETVHPAGPSTEEPSDVEDDSFTIRWTPIEGHDHYVNVYTREEGMESALRAAGNVTYVKGFKNLYAGDATEMRVTGLAPETRYYYTVTAVKDWTVTDPSDEKSVRTDNPGIKVLSVNALDASDVNEDSFTANWEPLEGATEYFLDVYTKGVTGEECVSNGFDSGLEMLSHWSTSAVKTYTQVSYCGESAPALRLQGDDWVMVTDLPEDAISVQFWHRGSSTLETDSLELLAVDDEEETRIAIWSITNDKGGATLRTTAIPAGTRAVKVRFNRPTGTATVAFDDMKVGQREIIGPIPVEGYANLQVGNATSMAVSGLNPATDYFYTVKGGDGRRVSLPSQEIAVTTGQSSGIDRTVAGGRLRISGRTVTGAAGELIRVYNMAGIRVTEGTGAVTLPGAGLYIVTSSDGTTLKVNLK